MTDEIVASDRDAADVDLPDASSVLLLRDARHDGTVDASDGASGATSDGAGGVEVFVVERRKAGAFAGLLAYPGGKVDRADRDLPDDRHRGLDAAALAGRYGLDPTDADDLAKVRGWCVAAVREVFEEVGVLLAHRRDAGGLLALTDADLASDAFADARARLVARGEPWDWTPWLVEQDLVLDLGALAPWSRWITPEGEPRRFDTAFFVAAVPDGQHGALGHDEVEVVASRWLTPQGILAERDAGTSVVIYPTRRQLDGLVGPAAPAGGAAAVLGAAADRDLRPIQPTIVVDGDDIVAHHPFDGTVESVF